MAHQGRVHKISEKAEEISSRIVGAIPQEKIIRGRIVRPIWYKIEFQDTAEERGYLTEMAKRYNSQNIPLIILRY